MRITYPGAFDHITSCGNERQAIYKSRADRLTFLAYLESATERYGAVIHCYCLVVNHYHLLLERPLGNLPQVMRHINGAYTTYFNIKRKRSGHLFQGRYKAIWDLSALKGLQNKPQISPIEAMVDRIVGKDAKLTRKLMIYLIRKCSGTSLKAIGARYGLGESGVSQVGRRLDKRKAEDAALRLVIAKIDRAIKK